MYGFKRFSYVTNAFTKSQTSIYQEKGIIIEIVVFRGWNNPMQSLLSNKYQASRKRTQFLAWSGGVGGVGLEYPLP